MHATCWHCKTSCPPDIMEALLLGCAVAFELHTSYLVCYPVNVLLYLVLFFLQFLRVRGILIVYATFLCSSTPPNGSGPITYPMHEG